MTVAELIEKLRALSPELTVVCEHSEDWEAPDPSVRKYRTSLRYWDDDKWLEIPGETDYVQL